MYQFTNQRSIYLISIEVDDTDRDELSEIRYALKNPHKISSGQVWQFRNLIKHNRLLIPATHPEAESIPITIATFLFDDIRPVPWNENRVGSAATNVLKADIKSIQCFGLTSYTPFFSKFVIVSLFSLVTNQQKNVNIRCIYGKCEKGDNYEATSSHIPIYSTATNIIASSNMGSLLDFTKLIQAMTNIISICESFDGNETKPFTHRLERMMDQMKAANIGEQHQQVFFTFTYEWKNPWRCQEGEHQ